MDKSEKHLASIDRSLKGILQMLKRMNSSEHLQKKDAPIVKGKPPDTPTKDGVPTKAERR